MQGQVPTYSPSICRHNVSFDARDNGLGQLFRTFGEEYIGAYKPNQKQINLIRSIRICRTPQLGGTAYQCKDCGDIKYVYYGCGNSQCPKCQSIKRMQWQEKLKNRLFNCPYQHIVFTMPYELNNLARNNPTEIYNCLLKSSWQSLYHCCQKPENLGATPGAIMVLHTFGSDLKYHVHVHALVTFGGIDKHGKWHWPARKKKIVPFREIRYEFREHFLANLCDIYPQLEANITYDELVKELLKKSWCVHQNYPTANAHTIAEYLGKYINRIGLSLQRFRFDEKHNQVTLTHKDYRNNKNKAEPPPMATKTMQPLVAIHQIIQHCLPFYFHKCRYLGIHGNAAQKKSLETIPALIKNNGATIKTMHELITTMIGISENACEKCGSVDIEEEIILPNSKWIHSWLEVPTHNKDPVMKPTYSQNHRKVHPLNGSPMSITHENTSKSTVNMID